MVRTDSSLHVDSRAQIGWLGLMAGGRLVTSLHASYELSESSQWLCHDDNTINSGTSYYCHLYPTSTKPHAL